MTAHPFTYEAPLTDEMVQSVHPIVLMLAPYINADCDVEEEGLDKLDLWLESEFDEPEELLKTVGYLENLSKTYLAVPQPGQPNLQKVGQHIKVAINQPDVLEAVQAAKDWQREEVKKAVEEKAEQFSKFKDQEATLAPQEGAPPPKGSVKLETFNIPRRC